MPAPENMVQDETLQPETHVRWGSPQRVSSATCVGRDTLAVAHDVYIMFFELRTRLEHVYRATGGPNGDGVDVIAGHRSNLFAFAEKVKHARIFIMSYPGLEVVAQLRDADVNRYKGLCMMEHDLVAGFSGFPDYLVSVWSWRTAQRLLSLPTGVTHRHQTFTASRSHLLLCQCWGEGLIVWEVAPCFKRCFMMRRAKSAAKGWELPSPALVSQCWTLDGQLYALDSAGRMYAVLSDGIDMNATVEWDERLTGERAPRICAFGSGVLACGPDDVLRLLKKRENKWRVTWERRMQDEVVQLVSNAGCDVAALWTRRGAVLRLLAAVPDDDAPDLHLHAFRQRNIQKIQMFAPAFRHLVTIDDVGVLCVYELRTGTVVEVRAVRGADIHFSASPVEPVLALVGAAPAGHNYGLAVVRWDEQVGLHKVSSACLTHQIVSRVKFSPSGRQLLAAAMAAGHVFIYHYSGDGRLTLVRYAELGRGLADCFLSEVGPDVRAFCLVLFSDKYNIGERIVCINAESGRDNKFAGKMQGPYAKLVPLGDKDTLLAVPHLSRACHVLHLSGEKGVTVSVKMGPVLESGHALRQYSASRGRHALLTYGADGVLQLRSTHPPCETELRLTVTHRYESGVRTAVISDDNSLVAHLAGNGTLAVTLLLPSGAPAPPPLAPQAPPPHALAPPDEDSLCIVEDDEKNYLDIQEEKKVREEALDYKSQRAEVSRAHEGLRARLVELLEENECEPPLHRLSLSEFNLHVEHKKDRLKRAEEEREDIRLRTEARIRAQDEVTAWIKAKCWDTMLTPRIKLYAIFSHYHVENFPVLPTQRDLWPELQQTMALRTFEMEHDADLFCPWLEHETPAPVPTRTAPEPRTSVHSVFSQNQLATLNDIKREEAPEEAEPYVLSGTGAHKFITVPPAMVPQTLAFSFLQMNWLYHLVKLNVQNMRLWFNKQFDELMTLKRREVGLLGERNNRLRFIIEELNKLSDLRGSFHHLTIQIHDPQWRQEEEPHKLIKVEVEECTISPYSSQMVVPPPELRPKDDFRERALNEMMDGVLEKLWHEEIKKPIPLPACMLEKEPEQFSEEDLRRVFDYEAKVAFRNEEREKYRKMLHAEYAKLSQVLNEGVVKFNLKVKDTWLLKLQVDSVIGQENLNLMRLRRTNLDRVEAAEELESMRRLTSRLEGELQVVQRELVLVQAQSDEAQAAYDALAAKERQMERSFKNHFSELSPIVVEQCLKFYKKRPKWHQRATMTPPVLNELAAAVLTGRRSPLLHADCLDYYRAMDQMDLLSNMPAVMDEALWNNVCRLRRARIENEIRMRSVVQETAHVDAAAATWGRALHARRARLASLHARIQQHRENALDSAVNRTVQLVLPAGQVEVPTSGHFEDFRDATLLPREDIETINNLILKVGELKLGMMRRQMQFRKVILAKEWEHAQWKMKLRHMRQELYSYTRLKIPKELQSFLKNKELGYTDEHDYVRLEKEMSATKMSIDRVLQEHMQRYEELQVRAGEVRAAAARAERLVAALTLRVSEKRLNEDPLAPIRARRVFKQRMETLVSRGQLIRLVQDNHSRIALLQTELELLRLRTYPTLATFRTIC